MDETWESDKDELETKDWDRVENNLEKSGYRFGLEASQEELMQDGFDQAFKQALTMARSAGRLQGAICASESVATPSKENHSHQHASSSDPSNSLENLNNRINSLVSEIPEILNTQKTMYPDECLCYPITDEANVSNGVKEFWKGLGECQSDSEKFNCYIDKKLLDV